MIDKLNSPVHNYEPKIADTKTDNTLGKDKKIESDIIPH